MDETKKLLTHSRRANLAGKTTIARRSTRLRFDLGLEYGCLLRLTSLVMGSGCLLRLMSLIWRVCQLSGSIVIWGQLKGLAGGNTGYAW